MKISLPLALFLFWSSQVDHQFPQRHIAGILEAPEIFGEYPCDRYEPQPVTVYAEASAGSAVMGLLDVLRPWYLTESSPCEAIEVGFRSADSSEAEPIRYMEHGYEESGLIVVERSGDWFEIVLPSGTGWVGSSSPERFHSYPQLVSRSLAYVNRGWPGVLWSSPGSGTPREISDGWRAYTTRELTIGVLETRVIDGDLWFKIRLDSEYGCGSQTETIPPEEGWVPGYGSSGENSLWFHSRGC
jgi:hypothetical protein